MRVILGETWTVRFTEKAKEESVFLPEAEKGALTNAIEKLRVMGPQLAYPHSSSVQGYSGLRELRPRAGRSPWRALYARIDDCFVIAAIGPEAECDRRGFDRAARNAAARLAAERED